ncbi:GAP family protein [Rubrobacter xylanophilus]|uniref:GAP family protein n=1 Tax=Rubrobacter xylanophilus TaxID=49319 RepID=UPI00398A667A
MKIASLQSREGKYALPGLLAVALGLALIDSANPSAIAITIYLLLFTDRPASRVLAYAGGIVTAYLTAGVAIVTGLELLTERFGQQLESPAAYWVQAAIGAALVGYSYMPQAKRPLRERTPSFRGHLPLFGLGLTISAVEFSTAFPYLGLLSVISTAALPASQWLPILAAYNLVMVAPLLALTVLYQVRGARIREQLERLRRRLQARAHEWWPWLIAALGGILIVNALANLLTRHVVQG